MAPKTDVVESTAMPDRLGRSLRAVASRHRMVRIAIAFIKALVVTLAVALATALLLGRFPTMPFALRWGMALLAWLVILAASIRFLRPAFGPLDLTHAATSMDVAKPESEERFLTAVEFTQRRHDALLGSPQLVDHVIGQAAADAQGWDPQQAVSLGLLGRWALYCAPLVLAWVIIAMLLPGTISLGLKRVVEPWATVVPVNQNIHVTPGNVAIGQGDSISVRAAFRSAPPRHAIGQGSGVSIETRYSGGQNATSAMTRIGPKSFRHDFADNQGSFRYRIVTAQGASAWYRVKVLERPAITLYEKHYTYPSYTNLPPKVMRGDSGALTAIQGSQVQLIIRTTEPLNKKSALILAPGTPAAKILPLTPVGLQVYQATLTLWKTTSYKVSLLNLQHVHNRGRDEWPVVVVPVLPPTIRILAPPQTIHVRPTDHVPVVFQAGDEFGLTAINAFVSIDGSAPRTYPLPLGATNLTSFKGQWIISVARLLHRWKMPHAKHIDYQLEAIDNAEPTEHVTETNRYQLIIDPGLRQSYQARLDEKVQRELRTVIQQAMQAIQQQQGAASQIAGQPRNTPLAPPYRHLATQVQKHIAAAGRKLATKSKKFVHTDYGNVAVQALKVAHGLLQRSANAMAQARFNADKPGQSQPLAAKSRRDLAQAHGALQRLMRQMNTDTHQIAVRRQLNKSLAGLARKETQISHALATTGLTPAISHLQQQAHQQLQQILHNHKVLQTPVAYKLQPALQKLGRQVGDIIRSQKQANVRLHAALDIQSDRQRIQTLAAQQQTLNQAIAAFNHSHQSQVQSAHATQPTSAMMQAVVQNLKQSNNAAGHAGQRHIAAALRSEATQLRAFSRRAHSAQAKAHQQQALQNQALADHLSRRVQRALADLQAKGPPAQSLEHVAKVAQALRQQADNMLNQNPSPQQRATLESARAAAKSAAHNALHQLGPASGSMLQQARNQLQQVAKEQVQAIRQQRALARKSRRTAHAVRKLAARQDALAAKTTQAIADLKPLNAKALQARQKKIAASIAAAAKLATQIKKHAKDGAPDIAQAVAQARQQMRRAAQQQTKAAKAQAEKNEPASQEYQQAALEHMQIAKDDLNGLQNSPELAELPRYQQWQAHAGEVHPDQTTHQADNHKSAGTHHHHTGHGQQDSFHADHGESAPMLAAAEHIQAAMAAQQNALNGDATAAAEAAQSLQSAAHSMSQTSSMPNGELSSQSSPMASTATGHSKPGRTSTGMSAHPSGLSGSGSPGGKLPPAITALGISPAQWENLGPLRQQRLINIARQKLPPGYRRLIRSYYMRIARMSSSSTGGS